MDDDKPDPEGRVGETDGKEASGDPAAGDSQNEASEQQQQQQSTAEASQSTEDVIALISARVEVGIAESEEARTKEIDNGEIEQSNESSTTANVDRGMEEGGDGGAVVEPSSKDEKDGSHTGKKRPATVENVAENGSRKVESTSAAEGGTVGVGAASSSAAATVTAAVAVPPERPIKRARTAYFIFAEDKRQKIQAEHPGEGVATIARVLGQRWSSLDPSEKEKYQQRAAEERARVSEQLAAWKAANGGRDLDESDQPNVGTSGSFDIATSPLTLPMQKVRKICKLDPDVRNVSKEACLLIAKCAEQVLAKLGEEAVTVAQLQNRRKLRPDDVAEVCTTRERFGFLKEDIRDLLAMQQKQQASDDAGKSKVSSLAAEKAASGSKPLTEYFAASGKKPKDT